MSSACWAYLAGLPAHARDEALQKLAALDPRQARVVELRFFAGLGDAEIADLLGINERTVRRDWDKARAWLADACADLA